VYCDLSGLRKSIDDGARTMAAIAAMPCGFNRRSEQACGPVTDAMKVMMDGLRHRNMNKLQKRFDAGLDYSLRLAGKPPPAPPLGPTFDAGAASINAFPSDEPERRSVDPSK
jgi:hypothetical protein